MDHETDGGLADAERRGLRLAVIGRNVALVPIAVFVGVVGRFPGDVLGVGIVAVFFALGLGYLRLLASGRERRWHRFVFVGLDCAALAALALAVPVSMGDDVPQIFVLRTLGIAYLFIVVAATTLTLMPGLVATSGVISVAGLWVVWLTIVAGMDRTVSWSDLPPRPSVDEFYAVFFDPDFVGRGNRVLESVVLLSTAGLLALGVARARTVLRRQVAAERDRRRALEAFGQYVPAAVAETLVDRPESLAPQSREASVVFADVDGFTRMAEGRPPGEVLALLSALFEEVGAIVAAEGGVVIGFAGDAVVASFNAPLDCPDHAARALVAAAATSRVETAGLRLRVGVATGPVATGTVGGAERQAFTVYGDTVNLAQRLEAANKDHATRVLAHDAAWEAAGRPAGWSSVGHFRVRNREAVVAALTLDPGAEGSHSGFCAPTK